MYPSYTIQKAENGYTLHFYNMESTQAGDATSSYVATGTNRIYLTLDELLADLKTIAK